MRGMQLAGTLALVTATGCKDSPTTTSKSHQPEPTGSRQSSARMDVLFTAVVDQMRNLASYVNTDLTPPVVILDSKKSSDGNDVMAVCTTQPDAPDGPVNYLTVAGNPNGRFRTLGVRPGDILKFYATYDPESLEAGFARETAIDLTVAQVLSDNTLLIAGGLNQPVLAPAKIEIWRYVDDRLREIRRQLDVYATYRRPTFDWEPSPDDRVLNQIVERLNQWMRQSEPNVAWSADPLLLTLPAELAGDERLAPLITVEALSTPLIAADEGRLIQEAVWLRDVSRWAQGESYDQVERATALFDWTIRNVQLDADEDALPYRPWQTLMQGHGTAEQRAWVFALLARQQGLDVVVLKVGAKPAAEPDADGQIETQDQPTFWLPALVLDGELYLFDARLGLPIPGPEGQGVATLAQVEADELLLRQLDLDDATYPISAEQAHEVTAHIVADPFSLSRRAKAIESKLTGDDRLALTVAPSEIAAMLEAVPAVASVQLWNAPFRILRSQLRVPQRRRLELVREFEPFTWQPMLWKARVLHFQGHRGDEEDEEGLGVEEMTDDHAVAVRLYTSRRVRPPDRVLDAMDSDDKRRIYSAAKDMASYCVGLLLFDQDKYSSAETWFGHPQLSAGENDPWTNGTQYNLARTYEAQGKLDAAITLLESDTSPQRDGNRLRARWLKAKSAETNEPEAAAAKTD